jgi:epoxyqueuosine reductase
VNPAEKTAWLVAQARALGMDLCGVAPADDFPELAHGEEWLARGFAGEMRYLHDPRRRLPTAAMHGARSIVVCALNYNSPQPYSTETPTDAARGWISRYAWGDDYHEVFGEKLEKLLAAMRRQFGEEFAARAYVDAGPVAERVAAKYAGLGWLAKNTCLINEQLGSWLFLGVILTSLELGTSLARHEAPPPDLCGNCRLCIDACPTAAIVEPYVLDARRCISYLTIELRGSIPEEFRAPMGRMVFGCDICQDVCPWNRKAAITQAAAFQPRSIETRNSKLEPRQGNGPEQAASQSLFAPPLEWLASLSEEEFRGVFRGSAVKRTKWRGLVRNACIALGNAAKHVTREPAAQQRICALLERLAAFDDPAIADAARWALGRL